MSRIHWLLLTTVPIQLNVTRVSGASSIPHCSIPTLDETTYAYEGKGSRRLSDLYNADYYYSDVSSLNFRGSKNRQLRHTAPCVRQTLVCRHYDKLKLIVHQTEPEIY